MIASNRTRRAQFRQLTREVRATRRAARSLATGAPQSAWTHLVASGVDTRTAKRFSSSFSNGVQETKKVTRKVKLKRNSRLTKACEVKLYDRPTALARLAVYRPQNRAAAAVFERAAQRAA